MEVTLPSNLNKRTMYQFLQKVVCESGQPIHNEYRFNFTTCTNFIEPIGVTFLDNLILWLLKRNIPVVFTYDTDLTILNNTKNPQRFLDDCGFFEKYIGRKIYENSQLRSTTVSCQNVDLENFPIFLENKFIPWLCSIVGKSQIELATFKVCIEEIFNNAKDHAKTNSTSFFAQHFPQNSCLIISIADMGPGIIEYIKSFPEYKDYSDEIALRNAVTRRFTTKSTPRNGGAGLDYLIQNVAMNAGGTVYIYTNKGILLSRRVENDLVQTFTEANHYYPGTHLEIEIDYTKADLLFDDYEEEEFEW